MLCFGVYSAMSVNYSVSGSVSYEVTDVFVRIDLSVYRSMSTAPIGSGDNSTNASKIQSAEDITSLGFKKLEQFQNSVSSYNPDNPETGEVEHPGKDWTAESYDGLNFTYGTPGAEDSNAYAFYIVLDITNYGSETINATVTNNTESTTANTRFAQTDNVEIEASNGEPYSTNRIVLGLALEDATQSISDAMGDFSYTVNVQRGNLEYQVISDMMFTFDDINKTATLQLYTGSATEVKIPASVSNVIIEPEIISLKENWGIEDIMSLTSDMSKAISLMLPSTITFVEGGNKIESLMPRDDFIRGDFMMCMGQKIEIAPLYVENGGSYTIDEVFFDKENGFAIPSSADELLSPLQLIMGGGASSVTYKVGNGEEGEEVVVTADNVEDAMSTLRETAQDWIDYASGKNLELPKTITFSNIRAFQAIEGNEYDVITVVSGAFSACEGITDIFVDSNSKYLYNDENGVLFDKNETTLIQYPIGKTQKSYTIPDGVQTIGISAFEGCNNLSEIIIPISVQNIGDHAFRSCTNLVSITISDGVQTIGSFVFRDCTNLETVTIGKNVKVMGNYVFDNCTSLTSVNFEDKRTPWTISNSNSTQITTADLSNLDTMATYLKSTYCSYAWTKNV